MSDVFTVTRHAIERYRQRFRQPELTDDEVRALLLQIATEGKAQGRCFNAKPKAFRLRGQVKASARLLPGTSLITDPYFQVGLMVTEKMPGRYEITTTLKRAT